MAFDDQPLHHTISSSSEGQPEPPPARPSVLRWILVGLAGVAAGALLTFWWMSRAQPTTSAPPSPTAHDVAIGSNRPKRQPIDLPSLNDSDPLIRQLVSALSKSPWLARFLATPGLLRAGALAIVQIGDGRTPADPLRALRPTTRLQIDGSDAGRIDPQSYGRWNGVATAVASIDPVDAAQLYVNVKPLIDEAYIDLGHSGEDFDSAIVRAIEMLRDTPEPAAEPMLLKRPGYFEYDDPALRALRPVQKQFLLMGPDNRKRIVGWLEAIAGTLDLQIQ
jgi:hypothetical protein